MGKMKGAAKMTTQEKNIQQMINETIFQFAQLNHKIIQSVIEGKQSSFPVDEMAELRENIKFLAEL